MYLPRSLISHLYLHLLRTHHPLSPPVLILVALEPDALCACRILTSLLKRDYIPHKIHPIAGYADLTRAGEELVRPMRLAEGGSGGVVACLGVGGLVDLEGLLGLGVDEEGGGGVDGVEIWVFDARRPWNLTNMFGGLPTVPHTESTVMKELGVAQGEISRAYRPGKGGIVVFDDGDIQEELRAEKEAWHALEAMPEVDEEDVSDGSDSEIEDTQSQTSSQRKRKSWSDREDEDEESDKENARPRRRRRSNSVSMASLFASGHTSNSWFFSRVLPYPPRNTLQRVIDLQRKINTTRMQYSSLHHLLTNCHLLQEHQKNPLLDLSAANSSNFDGNMMRRSAHMKLSARPTQNLSHLSCILSLPTWAVKIMISFGFPSSVSPAQNYMVTHLLEYPSRVSIIPGLYSQDGLVHAAYEFASYYAMRSGD